MTRQYAIVRGRMLDDPDYQTRDGTETVVLHIGVRMPTGCAEPVTIHAGDTMPAYCRHSRLRQGDMLVVSGWIQPETLPVWPGTVMQPVMMRADMLAIGTSIDWSPAHE
ncbi:hypothetical protein [Bifidobacterium tissieri]|uniref:hypothetical protein n=1 Tax=Bifidobacterium tissieri TaxID=1630162 RepID=UPI001239A8AD|nr:hypothetical protein [Bifidobacterium tissieri]KAA8830179.1 hypothetical protein EM849_10395 [Bifidobacterium tissieri]